MPIPIQPLSFRSMPPNKTTKLHVMNSGSALLKQSAVSDNMGSNSMNDVFYAGARGFAVCGALPIQSAITRCIDGESMFGSVRKAFTNVDSWRAILPTFVLFSGYQLAINRASCVKDDTKTRVLAAGLAFFVLSPFHAKRTVAMLQLNKEKRLKPKSPGPFLAASFLYGATLQGGIEGSKRFMDNFPSLQDGQEKNPRLMRFFSGCVGGVLAHPFLVVMNQSMKACIVKRVNTEGGSVFCRGASLTGARIGISLLGMDMINSSFKKVSKFKKK